MCTERKMYCIEKDLPECFVAPQNLSFLTYLKNNPLPFWKEMPIESMWCASQFSPLEFKVLSCTMSAWNKILMGNTPVKIQ